MHCTIIIALYLQYIYTAMQAKICTRQSNKLMKFSIKTIEIQNFIQYLDLES